MVTQKDSGSIPPYEKATSLSSESDQLPRIPELERRAIGHIKRTHLTLRDVPTLNILNQPLIANRKRNESPVEN